MKINEEEKIDRFGITPCCRVCGKDANPQEIWEWLYRNYQGYKFAVIFDCTKDEYETPEKQTPVYFLDEAIEEMIDYVGLEKMKRIIEEKRKRRSL